MFCEGIGESKPNKSLVSGIVSAMENKWGPCPAVFHVGPRKRIIVASVSKCFQCGALSTGSLRIWHEPAGFPRVASPGFIWCARQDLNL